MVTHTSRNGRHSRTPALAILVAALWLILAVGVAVLAPGLVQRQQPAAQATLALPQPAANPPAHVHTGPVQTVAEIGADAADVPASVARAAGFVRIDLQTVEVDATLNEGTTYHYWTFNRTVPGPMLRVRVGDTVEIHLTNADGSAAPHSIDLHAVSGPGGGSGATQTQAGAETSFRFKALNPGLYVYHCATQPVPVHIANGMFGLILVEPEGGLPAVDREFYVMQSELYTTQPFGTRGRADLSYAAIMNERPTYYVFNGRVGSLIGERALKARVGDRVRIYFGVGTFVPSNLHVIGGIFDTVYPEAAVGSEPIHNVALTLVPAGGATIVEMSFKVPGTYLIVDHALQRAAVGALGQIVVEGEPDPGVFSGGTASAGH